jgi:hypothetical protein
MAKHCFQGSEYLTGTGHNLNGQSHNSKHKRKSFEHAFVITLQGFCKPKQYRQNMVSILTSGEYNIIKKDLVEIKSGDFFSTLCYALRN